MLWSEVRSMNSNMLFWTVSSIASAYLALSWFKKNKKPTVTHGMDPLLQRIIQLCPTIRRGPCPPIWFSNCHLQFIPWLLQNELHRLIFWIPYERIPFEVTDRLDKVTSPPGKSGRGSSLSEEISLDVWPPVNDSRLPRDAPAILFCPGLRCHSHDLPGTTVVRRAFANGYRSIVVNRRGHTRKAPLLKTPRWSLFGDVDDMEQVYWFVTEDLLPGAPLCLHGLSSGTGIVVSGLGCWDARRAKGIKAPIFFAAVGISPGYDITTCLERFDWPYEPLLLANVKRHFVTSNEAVLRGEISCPKLVAAVAAAGKDGVEGSEMMRLDREARNRAVDDSLAATTLQGFLEAAVPFTGYKDAATFYENCNPTNDVHHITTPLLILNALDDPCCKYTNALEASPSPAHQGRTYQELVACSPRGVLAFSSSGSHCPFLDGAFFPVCKDPLPATDGGSGWMLRSWADDASVEWFDAWGAVLGGESTESPGGD